MGSASTLDKSSLALQGGAFVTDTLASYLQYQQSKSNINANIAALETQNKLTEQAADAQITLSNEQARRDAEQLTKTYKAEAGTARVSAAVTGMDTTQGSASAVYSSGVGNYVDDMKALSTNYANTAANIARSADMSEAQNTSKAAQLRAAGKAQAGTWWLGSLGSALGTASQMVRTYKTIK